MRGEAELKKHSELGQHSEAKQSGAQKCLINAVLSIELCD